MIFKKSEWLIKVDKDIQNGYLTEQEKQDALDIWVNDADGKTYEELGWDEEQILERGKAYQKRLKKEQDAKRIAEIKPRLNQLSEDIVQHQAGEIVPNYPQRLEEFRILHNELRVLEGKEPRQKQIEVI